MIRALILLAAVALLGCNGGQPEVDEANAVGSPKAMIDRLPPGQRERIQHGKNPPPNPN